MKTRTAICIAMIATISTTADASMVSAFDFGIASNGPISLTGNATIIGVNNRWEADVFSATYATSEAFKLNGNVLVQGDIFAQNPSAYTTLIGSVSIGGVGADNPSISQHIHTGVAPVVFPEVDGGVFEPFATNIVDSSTNTQGNKIFTNIRIKAGTNPTFTGNITLKGVVFIEAPNTVTFTGNLNQTGVIVTQDAGDNVYMQNTIMFNGNTDIRGVEYLPDTPVFEELRDMPGSFLLAPGFGVTFTGNFGVINGTMAADAFTWAGNAGGTVEGSIISYSDAPFSLTGNSVIRIDQSKAIARSQAVGAYDYILSSPGFEPIPEPATLALLAIGSVAMLIKRRTE